MMAMAGGAFTRNAMAAAKPGEKVSESPFARVEKITDGVWAIVSTPWAGNMTTISNGGIIAGTEGVAVIEGFNTPAGAAWASSMAKELTGREPTHVIITHFHADHSAGLPGYQNGAQGPAIVSTLTTRTLMLNSLAPLDNATPREGEIFAEARRLLIPDSVITDETGPTEIDLGGKRLRVLPRQGHTPSDIAIEILEPRILWCGDLVFNGMFPFFGDAIPSALGKSCNELLKDPDTLYVPGHGVTTDAEGLEPYLLLLEDVEAAARKAHQTGMSTEDAWKAYQMPESLSAWIKFRPDIFKFAFEAWEKELGASA
jgi:glyoxylase-like metal-dependent hydrolase (beta-lactamase superfamily II)